MSALWSPYAYRTCEENRRNGVPPLQEDGEPSRDQCGRGELLRWQPRKVDMPVLQGMSQNLLN